MRLVASQEPRLLSPLEAGILASSSVPGARLLLVTCDAGYSCSMAIDAHVFIWIPPRAQAALATHFILWFLPWTEGLEKETNRTC